MDGAIALKQAKNYVDKTLKGEGALKGQDGKDGSDGKSAYQIAVDNGFIGTESEWLESLKGKDGDSNLYIPKGGTIGQVLIKKSDDDYDLEWADNVSSSTNNDLDDYTTIQGILEDTNTDDFVFVQGTL